MKSQRKQRGKRTPGVAAMLAALAVFLACATAAGVCKAKGEASEAGVDCTGNFESFAELRAREEREAHAEAERATVFPALRPRAVAVVAHGLNLLPSRMDAITRELGTSGYTVVRAALSGHGGNLPIYRSVTRGRFLSDMHAAICEGMRLSREAGGVPLVLIAYSLGALVAEDLVNTPAFTRSPFVAQVLFAPALSVRVFTHAVRALSFLPWLQLPSLGFPGYRATNGTPIAAYTALFDSRSALLAGPMDRSRVPTLVLMNENDELVSLKGLRTLVSEKALSQWTIAEISKDGHRQPWRVNHMIIDPLSFSESEWSRVISLMRGALP